MSTTKLKIITPLGVYLEEDVEIVTLRTVAGEIGIQPNRLSFVSSILPSYIKINFTNKTNHRQLWINSGIVYADKKNIKIITDAVDQPAEQTDFNNLKSDRLSQTEIEIKKKLKNRNKK
ncbi:FoF1 ATP synthase subunit delta/epsilon [Candidatus Mycoplasma pogonae]